MMSYSTAKTHLVGGSMSTALVSVIVIVSIFISVHLIGPEPIGLGNFLTAPPYEFKIKLPSDFVSPNLGITALGIVKPGQNVRSETIVIDVERPDPPVRLASDSPFLTFREIGDELRVRVIGTFADHTKI